MSAQVLGYSLFAILIIVVILVTWTKSDNRDWPIG